jgi:hypothetical protein
MIDTSPDEIACEESVRQAISTFRARIDDLVGEFNEKLKSKIAVASEGQALTLRFGSKNIELWFEAFTGVTGRCSSWRNLPPRGSRHHP